MKKLIIATGAVTAAAGGTIAAANFDPKVRSKVEEMVPKSKEVFDYVLGSSESNVKQIKENMAPSLVVAPKKVYQPPPLDMPTVKEEEVKVSTRKPIEVSPVEIKQSVTDNSRISLTEEKNKLNNEIENKLMEALNKAQEKIQFANSAKIFTCEGINNYSKTFRQAVSNGVDADWNTVKNAKKRVEQLKAEDSAAEVEALKFVSDLEKVIDEGKRNPLTASNPLVYSAAQTVQKLRTEIDRTNSLIKKSLSEIDVLKDHKKLIEESRKSFLEEVKAVTPTLDINATGSSLTEKELNSLLVHAHLKVSKLNQRLIEQELREKEIVAQAIEKQKKIDEELARERLEREIEKVFSLQKIDKEAEVARLREEFDKEWGERLSREKVAHADHLEKVIRTQKEIHDIENAEKVSEAIQQERRKHSQEFELAISQLEGIEHALDKRAVLDIENRKAKQCWLACQNLLESIVYGVKAGNSMEQRRKPLEQELEIIKTAGKGDKFVETLVNSFDEDVVKNGVYTEEDLKNIFKKVYNVSRRVAKIDDNGGSLMKYISSYIQSLFIIEINREYSREDKIDINNISTYDILERTKYFVSRGDFETAVKLAQLLKGESKNVARSWIKDTQNFLNTRLLAELLVARAVVISACTIY